MANVKVYNKEGAAVGSIDLNDSIFGVEVNSHLMHLAVVSQLANKRQGTQSAKTRSEVSGGGRKPWKQKGTGHARQGSSRSPQWTGGGVVFAPKPRDYSVQMNKKEKAGAIKSALTSRVAEDKIFVMEDLAFDQKKTKQIQNMLNKLAVDKALIVTADKDENVILSARNIQNVRTVTSNAINVYDILKYSNLVISKDAVAKIEEVYA